MKERLSPTIGHPKLPGIRSIPFGVLHDCRMKKTDMTNTETSTMNIMIDAEPEPVFGF